MASENALVGGTFGPPPNEGAGGDGTFGPPPPERGAALGTGSWGEYLKNTLADIAGVAIPGASLGLLRASDLPGGLGSLIEQYRTPEAQKSTLRKIGETGTELAFGFPLAGPLGKVGAAGARALFPGLAELARPAVAGAQAVGELAGTATGAAGAAALQEAAAPITTGAVAAARRLALAEEPLTGLALGVAQTAGDLARGEASWQSALEKIGGGGVLGGLFGLLRAHGVGSALEGARAAADRLGFQLTYAEEQAVRDRLARFALPAEGEATVAAREARLAEAEARAMPQERPQPGAGEGVFGPQGEVPERPPGEAALGVERPAGRPIPLGGAVTSPPPFSAPRTPPGATPSVRQLPPAFAVPTDVAADSRLRQVLGELPSTPTPSFSLGGTPDAETRIAQALLMKSDATRGGALAYIPDLRAQVPQLNKEEFDAALMGLAEKGVVQLQRHDLPAELTPAVRNAMVRITDPRALGKDREGFYMAVGFRAGEPQAEQFIQQALQARPPTPSISLGGTSELQQPTMPLPQGPVRPAPEALLAPHLSDATLAGLIERGIGGGAAEIAGVARRAAELLGPEARLNPVEGVQAMRTALREAGWKRLAEEGAQAFTWVNPRQPGTVFKWGIGGGKQLEFDPAFEYNLIKEGHDAGKAFLTPGQFIDTAALRAMGIDAPEGLMGFTTKFAGKEVAAAKAGPGEWAKLGETLNWLAEKGWRVQDLHQGNVKFYEPTNAPGTIEPVIVDVGLFKRGSAPGFGRIPITDTAELKRVNADHFVHTNYVRQLAEQDLPIPARGDLAAFRDALIQGRGEKLAAPFRLKAPGCAVSLS